ncbi:Nuclear prelamin A recognition factor-like protein [Nosema bombycis CQ1]|uniref:Nuclear prelamin A recognition factor-like protein n=1 Tax=Nosema bombycis (strain CQ1 / CVCC 102059) TaxID=578461 RepID=R0MNQ7_NOSB1|nr:Nuclear prelamin A recognition factor-like protein [Nosema bombycis CQ1]|eukprot:EOB14493.1 Nuclear prelamin A recognition factor-like protein [Nosema bombycis CQ1]
MKNLFSKKLQTNSCIKEDGNFKIQLNDCLACSGCITDSEKLLTETNNDLILNLKGNVTFIIASQSKWSIFDYLNGENFEEFENYLCYFLREKFKIKSIYDTSYATNIITNELLKEDNKIISDCPGTVMYIERQASHLIKHLSKILTAQQILAKNKSNEIIVSVVQCYDKKLELSESSTEIDFILTTYEFMKLLEKSNFNYTKTTYRSLPNEQFRNNVGFNSGGYLNNILFKKYSEIKNKTDLNPKKVNKSRTNKLLEVNSTKDKTMDKNKWEDFNKIKFPNLRHGVTYNFIQKSPGYYFYEFIENNQKEVYVRIIGVENLINFMKEMKINPFHFKLVEAYICNFGCVNGPGQLKFEDIEKSLLDFSSIGQKSNSNELDLEPIDLYGRTFKKKEMKKTSFNVQW